MKRQHWEMPQHVENRQQLRANLLAHLLSDVDRLIRARSLLINAREAVEIALASRSLTQQHLDEETAAEVEALAATEAVVSSRGLMLEAEQAPKAEPLPYVPPPPLPPVAS